ncbi:hypothetical protein B0H13DRAFT_2392539 [Mycena leptocephala]|nr:hypothetical protein B0H13DRAFT_2392539 [Mycena leptocephala]
MAPLHPPSLFSHHHLDVGPAMYNTSTCCGTPAGEPGDVVEFGGIADPGVDALEFRTTRSGRLNHGHDESLAELDSGPPILALATIQPATSSTSAIPMLPKTRRDRDKACSKLKRQAEHTAAKAKTDILLDARPHHP